MNEQDKQIKEAIEKGIMKGKLNSFAKELDVQLEDLYNYYIVNKYSPTAEELVDEVNKNGK